MFKVDTPQGERFMVQLVGPASYRMGTLMAYRGQTLTVAKRTRDYLVRKTKGAWADFDPTPEEPIEEVMPPQFGEPGGDMIDMDDINPVSNPPMSMEHAVALAAKGKETATNGPISVSDDDLPGIDTSDLEQKPTGAPQQPAESGDLSKADLGKAGTKPASGGTSAASPKKGGVKVTTKATPKAETNEDIAQTVS